MARRLRLRLSLKVTLLVVCLLAATFLVLTPIVIGAAARQAKSSLVNETKSFASLSTKPIGDVYLLYRDSGQTKLREQVQKIVESDTSIANVTIVDVGGSVLYQHQPSNLSVTSNQAGSFSPIYELDHSGFMSRVIYPFIESTGAHRFTMVYEINAAEVKATLASLESYMLFAALAIMAITALLLTVLIELLFVRPLKRMGLVAASISVGHFDVDIKTKRRDEIGELGSALSSMADRLQEDINRLQNAEKLKSEFLVISSHNFRTPLTVITGYLDLLRDLRLEPKAREYVQTISNSAKQLTDLTNDMLTVAELEGRDNLQLKLETVDIAGLARKMLPTIRQMLDRKQHQLMVDLPQSPVLIKANLTYLQTSIWNLIHNAYKFTPNQGTIKLSLSAEDSRVVFKVADNGIGISRDEQDKLFTKFHRGTSVMKYEYEGIGLGLYMTKLMVGYMGGDITVQSQEDQGSTFAISLPMSKEAAPQNSVSTAAAN